MGRARGHDGDCVAFLRWALPRLRLRWEGFRKVRRQVCRRIQRRLRELGLPDLEAYRAYLGAHAEEWSQLDRLCTASVSRFHRDRSVFEALASHVLPQLAASCEAARRPCIRCWSAGCASGEEAYSLKILWECALARAHPDLQLRILATDVDATLLARAARARYGASSLRELPGAWREAALCRVGDDFQLRPAFREGVELRRADLRDDAPGERFDLILCRNLAFTYFEESLQREILERLAEGLVPGGALVLGLHEHLPPAARGFVPWDGLRAIHRRERDPKDLGFGSPVVTAGAAT